MKEPGLRALLLCAHRLGHRKSELQNLLVMQVADGWLRVFAGATKNGKARSVKLPADVVAVLAACAKGKRRTITFSRGLTASASRIFAGRGQCNIGRWRAQAAVSRPAPQRSAPPAIL
jgi:hypothetical protein